MKHPLAIGAAALLCAAPPLRAQGASVYTHSACALARAGTGAADPCDDGSAIFYSPASLAFLRSSAGAGVIVGITRSEFTFDDPARGSFESEQPPIWLPHLWINRRATPRFGFGIGAWGIYGLATEWPRAFEGRYIGYKNELRTIYIQPTAAYQLLPGRLAVGAGLDIVRGSVEVNQRLDLAVQTIPGTTTPFAAIGIPSGTDFANLRLAADDWTATFHLGLAARVTDRWALGARYLHTADLVVHDGTADFDPVPTGILLPPDNPFGLPAGTPLDAVLAPLFGPTGPLRDQRLRTDLTLPAMFVIGIRYLASPPLRLLFDYQWSGWNEFDEAPLDFAVAPADTLFLDFQDSNNLRLGAEYDAGANWILRAGASYNDAATPDVTVTPLLPEGERWNLAGGAGYRFGDDFRADAAIEFVFQEDRRGRVRPRTSRARTARELNVGVYEGTAVLFGLTLSYRFGTTHADPR